MTEKREETNTLTSIEILYKTAFEILSRTEFQGLHPNEIKAKLSALNLAYTKAKHLFRGNFRRNGRRYFDHLQAVTDIVLKELPHPSVNKLIVAMLHDMMEDTDVDFNTLKTIFGEEIAKAVNLLTKKPIDYYMDEGEEKEYVGKLSKVGKEAYYKQHKERLQPLKEMGYFDDLFGSGNDLALSVKIADRMHNLRDLLGSVAPEKIEEQIVETETYIIPGLESYGDTYAIGINHLKAYIANLKIYLASLKTGKEIADVLK